MARRWSASTSCSRKRPSPASTWTGCGPGYRRSMRGRGGAQRGAAASADDERLAEAVRASGRACSGTSSISTRPPTRHRRCVCPTTTSCSTVPASRRVAGAARPRRAGQSAGPDCGGTRTGSSTSSLTLTVVSPRAAGDTLRRYRGAAVVAGHVARLPSGRRARHPVRRLRRRVAACRYATGAGRRNTLSCCSISGVGAVRSATSRGRRARGPSAGGNVPRQGGARRCHGRGRRRRPGYAVRRHLPGVEIHANVLDNILRDDFVLRPKATVLAEAASWSW